METEQMDEPVVDKTDWIEGLLLLTFAISVVLGFVFMHVDIDSSIGIWLVPLMFGPLAILEHRKQNHDSNIGATYLGILATLPLSLWLLGYLFG